MEKTESIEALEKLEIEAQKITASPRWEDIAKSIIVPEASKRSSWIFSDHYPALKQLGIAQSALNTGIFKNQKQLTKEIEIMCEPFRSAQALFEDYNNNLVALKENRFSDLFKAGEYAKNISDALKNSVVPALEISKPDMKVISAALKPITAIDTSWMQIHSSWTIKTSDLFAIDREESIYSGLTKLIDMEQETARILRNTEQFTSVASQIASINKSFSDNSEKWNAFIAPHTLVEDLQNIAVQQHEKIQKDAERAEWRLGVLESTSRFADRQITWTNGFLSEIKNEAKYDETLAQEEQDSGISLIPQYLGYTNRANVDITPEEGFEKSTIVEVTEKGKRIIENVVTINELAASVGKRQIFKYTGKMMLMSSRIGSLFCSTKENFGKMIDGFYMIFYENLEHIKTICSDQDVRNEDVYQCIFRVKDMRTDLRHDYEHGKNIEKKRRDIADCYKHYTNKPVPIKQKDYVTLQNKMYDEFLALQVHLIEVLLDTAGDNTLD